MEEQNIVYVVVVTYTEDQGIDTWVHEKAEDAQDMAAEIVREHNMRKVGLASWTSWHPGQNDEEQPVTCNITRTKLWRANDI